MLASLKFVQGAVAKKDFLPALTHFHIHNRTVRGFNGTIAICSPIELDIDCKPRAEDLVRAIGSCDETVSLTLTKAGRLSIHSGKFKALIDCVNTDTPQYEPEGVFLEISGADLFMAFETLFPFVGNDASRPWTNGILLKDQSAFATNNVILTQIWTNSMFPHVVNVPRSAVAEVLRVKEPPSRIQLAQNNITFHYEDGRWIRSQLLSTDWPDLSKVLDRPAAAPPTALPPELFDGLAILKPFCDKLGTIIIQNGVLSTHDDPEEGATFNSPELPTPGRYNIEMLQLLENGVEKIDWTAWPSPCLFFGGMMRGAIVGYKPK